MLDAKVRVDDIIELRSSQTVLIVVVSSGRTALTTCSGSASMRVVHAITDALVDMMLVGVSCVGIAWIDG